MLGLLQHLFVFTRYQHLAITQEFGVKGAGVDVGLLDEVGGCRGRLMIVLGHLVDVDGRSVQHRVPIVFRVGFKEPDKPVLQFLLVGSVAIAHRWMLSHREHIVVLFDVLVKLRPDGLRDELGFGFLKEPVNLREQYQ